MKKITTLLFMILLFSTTINAQENFKSLWEKVQKFEVDNLPKSALKLVDDIYAKAKKEKNDAQLIKTLFYKSKFSLILEEDSQLKIINEFKKHIAESEFPTKNVLENILANLYWQYFNQHRYQFYNRTKTADKVDSSSSSEQATDFRTWDLNTLFEEIHIHYQTSIKEKLLLQQENLYAFSDILHVQKDSETYRPTLFDFLSHNALEFYKTSETNITKPAYQFKIDNIDLLKNARTFSVLNIESKDSLSLQFNALKIYQNLIAANINSKDKKALATIDLERLEFVKQHATFNNKEELYLQTLKEAKEKYKTNEVSGLYAFEIALIYTQKATSYTSDKNEENRFKNKEAIAICNQVIKDFPESLGAKKCILLKAQIEQSSLNITAEKYISVETNSRLLINYKNIDKLYFSAFKISHTELKTYQKIYKDIEKIAFIKKLEKQHTWSSKLRNENDYLQHTTEVVVPKLTNGLFLILATENQELNGEKVFGTTTIQSTDLTLIENNFDGQYNYQVVDRITGKPIKNATIHIKNYRVGRYNKAINKKLTTDKNGFASFKSKNNYSNVIITVHHKKETAFFGDFYFYNQDRNSNIKEKEKTTIKPFIFTDRSIYRPGQTVYFKAIVLKNTGDKSIVFPNEFVAITLHDVNGQEVKTLDLKLNEFGSVAGEFIIPNNGLTGEYSIEIEESLEYDSKFYDNADFDFSYDNELTFSVEEYKRPKFETEFKPVTETYTLNDSITLNGFAKSFSGSNITDGKVVYRVHRKVQYPSWYYWRRPNFNSEAQEITHGKSTTDATGNFSIRFKAIPDESVSKENNPIFTYEVTADVTDLNGETRSTTTTVKVGYHSLLATISMADKLDKNTNGNNINIDTKNLNGEFVPATGTVKIYKLVAPEKPLRKRVWAAPGYQDISESEFRKLFPHEPYTDEEGSERNWKKGTLVFETNFDTSTSKEIKLESLKNWISGKYIAVLESKDKFGNPVKDEQHFSLLGAKEKSVADNALFTISTDKTTYKPNENLMLQIGSASKNMTVVIQVEKNHKIVETCLVRLNNQTKTIKIPVTEDDLGGFAIKYHYVNYNYFESGNLSINVPQEQSTIEIETNIFRDKLQPGQDETWSFTIKNDKNDKVAAEVLASMYDASLDEFKAHNWQFNPLTLKTYYSYNQSSASNSFGTNYFQIRNKTRKYYGVPTQQFDTYNWFGFTFGNNRLMYLRKNATGSALGITRMKNAPGIAMVQEEFEVEETVVMSTEADQNNSLDEVVVTALGINREETTLGYSTKEIKKTSIEGIQIRKNLQETAFFFPQLKTDKDGKISFNFTAPEALTKWKLQLLAHTKDAKTATKTLTSVTQKELMIFPNAPRFLREGDEIVFSAKISNLTSNNLSGIAQLQLTDAITGKEINVDLGNGNNTKNFTVTKDGNTNISWNLSIPETVQAVQYKVLAKSGDFSDGEQNALPVLSNRMLVTETLPMWIRSNETKTFTLGKLKNNSSSTLKNHKLTLEMTSNPAWYAVQALPYLMEYPYECSEQTFSRYYANTLASFIANSNPRIQDVFNSWKSSDALLSNLEKNQELKSLIIQETPWLRDAQSETEQKKRIALLFDLNKLKNEQEKSIHKLKDMQMSSGGFPWFKGGNYPSAFITQHIAAGFGHLKKLGVSKFDTSTEKMIADAVQFLDQEIAEQYQKLLKRAERIKAEKGQKKYEDYLKQNHLTYFSLQYLYMRSFYANLKIDDNTKSALVYYKNQAAEYWNDFNLYGKGQIALIQFRNGNKKVANKILKSLKENSISSEELGMYWKANVAGYYNYQAPVETQALLIEAFSEIENDAETIDNLKIWLLKNKQTNRWKTTKATTEAVYALLLNGTDWISITEMVDIKIGNQIIEPSKLEDVKIEAGTGYFKTSWNGNEIKKEMANVTINKKGNGIAWGGLYWQYFEDLDKITSAETPLKLNKKLFLKVNSDTGKELKEITNKTQLKIGDLITVRIELRSDRDMEFIHMKDMRASGVEPINVLSRYKWQDGLGYYESTKDAATNFFFDRLPKGVYVFEYDVRVNNAGNFSNGITTIQSMYAPEFSSHSKGIRLKIKN